MNNKLIMGLILVPTLFVSCTNGTSDKVATELNDQMNQVADSIEQVDAELEKTKREIEKASKEVDE